jgi:5-methylcytosine-specific restriction endonuclease McrA
VTRGHQALRRTLIEEAGGQCALCGYDRCIVSLHFHHVDPATKLFPMTVSSGKSIATYRDEARKCVLLCSNCHGEVEAGLVASPPPGATYQPSLGKELND